MSDGAAVAFEHVSLAFDEVVVLRDVSFLMRAARLLRGASARHPRRR